MKKLALASLALFASAATTLAQADAITMDAPPVVEIGIDLHGAELADVGDPLFTLLEKTMHVKINTAALNDHAVNISNSAAETVRLGFNPSAVSQVDAIKSLSAALISECEAIRDKGGAGARKASVAITQIQGASMFAVAAATADLS